jgi:hypothetical protein
MIDAVLGRAVAVPPEVDPPELPQEARRTATPPNKAADETRRVSHEIFMRTLLRSE